MFQIYNDGSVNIYMNGFKIVPGSSFGVNLDALVAKFLIKGIPVVNNTQYQLTFDPAVNVNDRQSAQLIEVFIKIE